jgi:hypothetical protein
VADTKQTYAASEAFDPDMPPPPPDDWWPEETMAAPPVTAGDRGRKTEDRVAPPQVVAPVKPNGSGVGDNGGGYTGQATQAQTVKPAPRVEEKKSQPVSVSAFQPINGNRPRVLTITLARTGDQSRDASLLGEAHRLLTSRHGQDHFKFRLAGGGNGAIEMEFPNHSTSYSPELVTRLESMLGQGAVKVEMQR